MRKIPKLGFDGSSRNLVSCQVFRFFLWIGSRTLLVACRDPTAFLSFQLEKLDPNRGRKDDEEVLRYLTLTYINYPVVLRILGALSLPKISGEVDRP